MPDAMQNIKGLPVGAVAVPIIHVRTNPPMEAPEISETPQPLDLSAEQENVNSVKQSGAIEYSPQFQKAVNDAWMDTRGGNADAEGAFSINNKGQISPIIRSEGHRVVADLPPDTVAFVHTHANNRDWKPSPADVASAKRLGIPIITADSHGLYETDAKGDTEKEFDNLDWTNTRKHLKETTGK